MTDYISREAALESVREKVLICESLPDTIAKDASLFTLASMNDSLNSIPAADVRPVVKARWGEYEDELFGETIKAYCCSNCHHLISRQTIVRNYCPRCGANMREPPKEE